MEPVLSNDSSQVPAKSAGCRAWAEPDAVQAAAIRIVGKNLGMTTFALRPSHGYA